MAEGANRQQRMGIVEHAALIGSMFGGSKIDFATYIETGQFVASLAGKSPPITPDMQPFLDQIARDGKLIVPIGGFPPNGVQE